MNVKNNSQEKSPFKSHDLTKNKTSIKTSKIIEVYKKQKANNGKNFYVDENKDFLNQDDQKAKALIEIKENKIKELKEELRIKVQSKKNKDNIPNIKVTKKISSSINQENKEKNLTATQENATNRSQLKITNITSSVTNQINASNYNNNCSPIQSLPNETFRVPTKTETKTKIRDVRVLYIIYRSNFFIYVKFIYFFHRFR